MNTLKTTFLLLLILLSGVRLLAQDTEDANSDFEIVPYASGIEVINTLFGQDVSSLVSDVKLVGGGSTVTSSQIGFYNDLDTRYNEVSAGSGYGVVFSSSYIDDGYTSMTINNNPSDEDFHDGAGNSDADFNDGTGALDVASITFTINLPEASDFNIIGIFASDEYPEFVGASVNDAAKIFVDGVNIALVNGSELSVNTVNTILNKQFFINNDLFGGGNIPIAYDGITKPITFSTSLSAGPHTIKIGVADRGDSFMGSAFFFQGGSLDIPGLPEQPEPPVSPCSYVDINCTTSCYSEAFLLQGDPSQLIAIDLTTGNSTILGTLPSKVNAAGFNSTDGFIYAMQGGDLVRINNDLSLTVIDVPGLPGSARGDINAQGQYVSLSGGGTAYVVDINAGAIINQCDLDLPSTSADIAFSPIDNFAYIIENNNDILYRLNIDNCELTSVGLITGIQGSGNFGAFYMDNEGNLYMSRNGDGNIYVINTPHTGNTVANLFTRGPASSNNDGARCSLASVDGSCSQTANIQPSGVTSINGVEITSTSTGSVEAYTPSSTSCGNVTITGNALWVGQNGDWTVQLDFDEPVNNLTLLLTNTGNGGNENFNFSTNSGALTINDLGSCFSTISGQQILSGQGAPSTGAGGEFVISGVPYTSLMISGTGGADGSYMAICEASIQSMSEPPAPCDPVASGNIDTDGDGISDICDLDDDNDGILDTDECSNTSIPLFKNADFNAGGNPTDIGQLNLADGWFNVSEDSSVEYMRKDHFIGQGGAIGYAYRSRDGGAWAGFVTPPSTSSNYFEYIGGETINPITTGSYNLTLEVGSTYDGYLYGGAFTQDIVIYGVPNANDLPYAGADYIMRAGINAVELGRKTVTRSQDGVWADETIALTVNGTFEVLLIGGDNAVVRAGKLYQYVLIDNLRFFGDGVTSNCDTDNDGIPNYLDLDSDNDGCPDALEGTANLVYANLKADGSINTTVNNNGIPIIAGVGSAGAGTSGQ
ncbi:MAG: choice-of-anchor L domain-containing protein, partial [Saprospiraceae bacterium]